MQNRTLSEYWDEAKDIFQRRVERGEPEFPTGLNFLDTATDGVHRGEVWVIAGKSGGGKTTLALQIARSFAEDTTHSILFLSLEMKGWELVTRMFCEMMDIEFRHFFSGSMPVGYKEKEKVFREYIKTIDFEIFEFGFSFAEVEKIMQQAYATKKPDVIFIDFIQLIEWQKFGDERTALMEYIRKLKELAKSLNIGVVVVSQLRRLPTGADYNRAPDIIDLKGSGSLEQTADKVILVYSGKDAQTKDKVYYINLAKNRQGITLEKQVIFDGPHYKFLEIEMQPEVIAVNKVFNPTTADGTKGMKRGVK